MNSVLKPGLPMRHLAQGCDDDDQKSFLFRGLFMTLLLRIDYVLSLLLRIEKEGEKMLKRSF